jgi:hypothetical protein
MTANSESAAKHAVLHPTSLDEQMTVTQLVQLLETLRFDSHERARVISIQASKTFCSARPKPPPSIPMPRFATCGAGSSRDERSALPAAFVEDVASS